MNEKICRLCLQTISGNNCQTVKESLLKSLKLNINISKENAVCIECADGLRVFSNFTPGGAYTKDETLPSSDLDNCVELDPKAIKTTTNLKSLMETGVKCSFCTKVHVREDLISLEESKENKLMVNMLERYILEKILIKNTGERLACGTCLESLEGVLGVILKCVEVEEKIGKYIELEGTDDKGQVELKKVQQFTFRPILKSEIESFGVNELEDGYDQLQEEYTTIVKAEIKCEEEISNTELIIKTEDDIKSEQSDGDVPDIMSEESDGDGFQELFIEKKNPSEIKMFQCELCSHETKYKQGLERHLWTHKSLSVVKMFKCEICSHETKYKQGLEKHLLTHKSPSEVKMFKCELCQYETKYKQGLERHLLTHKSPSGVKMFKCEICSHETKYKQGLEKHILTHKSPFEVKMFKCEICSHETKYKQGLEKHLLTHKSPSEVKMFKCELCQYETKRKDCLKKHLLTHKSPSEIKMFKCTLCSYGAKKKGFLKRHLSTHKSLPEIKTFKCKMCSYETKYKQALKVHFFFTHKSSSEIKKFKCKLCSYQAKRKVRLEQHLLLVHGGLPNIKM